MSYEIITYSPDTGTDEHGEYRTQKEARHTAWCAQVDAERERNLDGGEVIPF